MITLELGNNNNMRKFIIILLVGLFCFTNIFAQVKHINKTDLPVNIIKFLDKFYNQNQFLCYKEGRYLDIEYEITIDNGTSLEFDRKGYLKSIDCSPNNYIHLSILPKELVELLVSNFKGKRIVEYTVEDRDTRYEQHEVEFDDGFELIFNGRLNNKY